MPHSEFLAATSLNSAQFNLGRIAGPALAGATVAAFGYPVAFVANAASFLAVVVALAFVHLGPPAGQPSGLLSALRSGFTAARREPACRAAIGTIAVVAFLASPFIALRLSVRGQRRVIVRAVPGLRIGVHERGGQLRQGVQPVRLMADRLPEKPGCRTSTTTT